MLTPLIRKLQILLMFSAIGLLLGSERNLEGNAVKFVLEGSSIAKLQDSLGSAFLEGKLYLAGRLVFNEGKVIYRTEDIFTYKRVFFPDSSLSNMPPIHRWAYSRMALSEKELVFVVYRKGDRWVEFGRITFLLIDGELYLEIKPKDPNVSHKKLEDTGFAEFLEGCFQLKIVDKSRHKD